MTDDNLGPAELECMRIYGKAAAKAIDAYLKALNCPSPDDELAALNALRNAADLTCGGIYLEITDAR